MSFYLFLNSAHHVNNDQMMEAIATTAAIAMLLFYGAYAVVAHGIALGFGCVTRCAQVTKLSGRVDRGSVCTLVAKYGFARGSK